MRGVGVVAGCLFAQVCAASKRPHVAAGYGCKMGQENVTEYLDYRWELLDSVHYHDAVGLYANGTTGFFHGCDYPGGSQFQGLKAVARAHGVKSLAQHCER